MNTTTTDSIDETSVRQLSDLQETVLAVLPLPSALLSAVGSSIILWMALESRKRKQWTPYTRLLVALSLCDILYSVSISISSFARPKNSSHFVFAVGNDASCNASGFLNQLGMSAIFYNSALSFYFLATARFGLTAKQFSRAMEKIIHLVSLGHPLLTASMGLYLGLYAERRGIMGCWLEFDKRCISEDPEIRGQAENCTFRYTGVLFYVLPAGGTLISLLVNNFVIWRFVHNKVQPSRHRPLRRNNSSSSNNAKQQQKGPLLLERSPSSTSVTSSATDMDTMSRRSDSMNSTANSSLSTASTFRTKVPSAVSSRIAGSPSASASSLQHSTSIGSNNSMNDEIQKAQLRRLKLVRSQAFLFVASYFLCHIWSVIMATGDFLARGQEAELEFLFNYYPVALLQAWFQPLQGMLNMMVFVRPKYLKCKHDFPLESKWWALKRAILGERRVHPTHRSEPNQEQQLDEEEDMGSEHFVLTGMNEMKRDDDDDDDEDDNTHTLGSNSSSLMSSSSTAYSKKIRRENVSTLTASLGDFDHVIDDGVEDERWATSERSETTTSWGPPIRRTRHSTTSCGTRGSSLEVISETTESVFEAFPTAASISSSVASAKKDQQQAQVPSSSLSSTPISPEQKEGRWSPTTSPTGRVRPIKDLLALRLQAVETSDGGLTLMSPPESPSSSRWSSEILSPKPEATSSVGNATASATATSASASPMPLPRRVESLNDTSPSSSPPQSNSPKSIASLSPPFGSSSNNSSSGNSVSSNTTSSSASSSDSPLVPPRRRLSPPPFAKEEQESSSSSEDGDKDSDRDDNEWNA